ncbi:MAG: DUF4268 domain-containing protein [Candidatus Andersenbacteria bacterium]|nr:DUF4268 domain-containing protein [Candidatus Andersenbacteria bacterium]MBI3250358.1 DUF4268 domain-containing protein [Candidatus Andersenbacteria bacterium]
MIGKLQRVPLREIWKNEAKDFTSWLAENIDALNEALETSFSIVEKEKSVGSFYLDIMLEDSDGHLAIVENQLEKTDHDHLGKVLTYMTNLDAKAAIWITSSPREEHEKAVHWLNEHTPADIAFYLVQVEAVKIGGSDPAPLFTVIVQPTEIAKEVGLEKKEYAERHHLRKEFWQQLLEKAKERTKLHSNTSPTIYSWIGTGAGKSGLSFNYVITTGFVGAELYLDRGKEYPTLNKERFDALYKHKDVIENTFGGNLTWERLEHRRACRISFRFKEYGLKDKATWEQAQIKVIDAMVRLEKALRPYIKSLPS